jgi:surface carbohydrate biosynthesis protein
LSDKINVLFPIEIINRELDFRLWLAVLYASPGRRIWVGQHDEIFYISEHLRGGIYVGKNMFLTPAPADASRYRAFKDRGFTMLHLDEEGLSAGFDRASFEKYVAWRLDASVLSSDDYVCTWGDAQRDFYRTKHVAPDKVRTTGHPRFDLYDPEHRAYYDDDVAKLRARYGEFILFNTNFPHSNNALGVGEVFKSADWYNHDDVDARMNHFTGWAHQVHLLANLVKLVNAMAVKWPNKTIVVRPHPNEDWGYYETIFYDLKNVVVVHEGSVGPWLFASNVLIHHACTTAIEAHLSDIPIIDYKSYEGDVLWRDENRMPERFGALVTKEQEVLDLVAYMPESRARLRADRLTPDTRAILANLSGGSSFGKLMAVMEEAEATLPASARGSRPGLRRRRALRLAKLEAKKVVRPLLPAKMAVYTFQTKNNFYGLEAADIARRLERIQRIAKKKVTWHLLGSDVLTVESG